VELYEILKSAENVVEKSRESPRSATSKEPRGEGRGFDVKLPKKNRKGGVVFACGAGVKTLWNNKKKSKRTLARGGKKRNQKKNWRAWYQPSNLVRHKGNRGKKTKRKVGRRFTVGCWNVQRVSTGRGGGWGVEKSGGSRTSHRREKARWKRVGDCLTLEARKEKTLSARKKDKRSHMAIGTKRGKKGLHKEKGIAGR